MELEEQRAAENIRKISKREGFTAEPTVEEFPFPAVGYVEGRPTPSDYHLFRQFIFKQGEITAVFRLYRNSEGYLRARRLLDDGTEVRLS